VFCEKAGNVITKQMPVGKALLFLIPIAAYIVLFVAILSLLGFSQQIWLGFLLLWYWGMEKLAGFDALVKTIFPGALTGIAAAYLLHTLPPLLGTVGTVFAFVLVAFLVLCTLTGWLKMFVNGATFLLVTILSVPAIADTANHLAYLDYIGVVVVSSIFIGATAWLTNRLRESRSKELPANQ
jgi:hypothetical protein